ncbi:MAG: hypothetical protein E6H00_16350 [Bacillati bacterium ANGP1]|uniref:Uncharacterized protein n=1 Tax=Candidatus Segetimicrobium genomatis TaxID=2569760 RepID=A0A537JVG9_9BACT|nr:MAG: hypothetical protein E6H00_16350 [Terrabacteria group bacterium ANGP1]
MRRAAQLFGPADGVRPRPERARRGGQVAQLLAVILLGPLSPASVQIPSGAPLPFVTIAAGATSSIRTPSRLVVRNDAEWRALWRRHDDPAGGAAPRVDFNRDMVIGVFAGEIRGPAAVAIVRVTRDPDRLVVWYTFRDTSPIPAVDSNVPSAPFSIIRLPRSSLPVGFVQVKTPQVLRRP